MNCWRCDVKLHSANDSNICRLCEIEVDGIINDLVRIWRYSEDRLFAHRGYKGYREKKLEVYSTLLYTYVWKMRMVDKETRQYRDMYRGDFKDAAGYSQLQNLNSKDFLEECWQDLANQGLVEEVGNHVLLFPGVPKCTL